ncbi:TPA: hypothetical protein N0F65_007672 [Lagenidium giganteum]|uniref:Nucleotide-sugar transporter n=1 Tax=Lagenidium giganteum TaxID=4803 RepID=A0AAV2ZA21_9STRA|nr:TPA: hypothetical protein N0F65_007672 [Lagenidium giganteum]
MATATSGMALAGYVSMTLLAVQFGLQPILYKEFAAHAKYPSILVIACEVCKFAIASVIIVSSGNAAKIWKSWHWWESVQASGLPACTYAVQNVLVQISYQNLPPIIFNLINQTKLLWTALFLFVLMGKRFSLVQCVAMLMLLSAAVLLSVAKDPSSSNGDADVELDFQLGLLPVIVASILSGVGATITQRSMQVHRRDVSLVTMELALYGSIFLVLPVLLPSPSRLDSSSISAVPISQWLDGWDSFTLIPIVTNAMGGLLVGAVTKHVGGVLKSFALICGIAFTAFVESYLYGSVLPTDVYIAAVLVAISMSLYSSFPYVEPAASKPKRE